MSFRAAKTARNLGGGLVLASLSGILLALSFADYSISWLSFVALLPLFIALARSPSARSSFVIGWTSQTVAWLIMVPWVIRVMSHYGGLPYPVGVAIFIAMALYLGLYGALFGVLLHRIRPGDSLGRWLLVPLAWVAVEYFRTYLLMGFPWNIIATTLI